MPAHWSRKGAWTPVPQDYEVHDDGEEVRPPNGIVEFRGRYDVYTEFIPFGNREYNPLERLRNMRRYIDGMTKLTTGFTVSDLENFDPMDEKAQSLSGAVPEFFYVCGSRPLDRTAHKSRNRYANPKYVHLHTVEPVEDDDERRELLRTFAHLGVVSLEYDALPAYFGFTDDDGDADDPMTAEEKLRDMVYELDGFDWAEERAQGKRKIARTWHISNRWGTPTQDIATAFGVSQQLVARWIQAYSINEGFIVPDDPTNGGWRREEEQAKEIRERLGIETNQ